MFSFASLPLPLCSCSLTASYSRFLIFVLEVIIQIVICLEQVIAAITSFEYCIAKVLVIDSYGF